MKCVADRKKALLAERDSLLEKLAALRALRHKFGGY
jgi:hypothetical protein